MLGSNYRIFFSLVVLLILSSDGVYCQIQTTPPMRQVIGSNGKMGTYSGGSINYTVGECMVAVLSPAIPISIKNLTQGFHQPNSQAVLSVNISQFNSTCLGANNGSAALSIVSSTGPITISWSSPVSSSNAVVSDLSPGVYYYQVSDGNFTINDSVRITEDSIVCQSEFIIYTGITPNGDGDNDKWEIDGIGNYPENKVYLYNRWGGLVWKGKNYDNMNTVWSGKNSDGTELPDATYFYLIELEQKHYKGWVELTH